MSESRESIVPRIYVVTPKSGLESSQADCPIVRPLAADLLVAYAYDMETHYTIVPYRDLSKLGLTELTLHLCAIENLRRLKFPMNAHGGTPVYRLTADGNYEAAVILLPEVCQFLASMVTGKLIASVAARDLLFYTGDSDSNNIVQLRSVTSKAMENAAKPLSRQVIMWNGSNWEASKA